VKRLITEDDIPQTEDVNNMSGFLQNRSNDGGSMNSSLNLGLEPNTSGLKASLN
jgi:hypothetical protein